MAVFGVLSVSILAGALGVPLAGKFRTVLGGLLRLDLRTATTHFSLSDRDASGTLILLQSLSGVPCGHRIAARPGSRVDRKLDTSWNSGAPRRGHHLNSADLPTIRNPSRDYLVSVLPGLAGFRRSTSPNSRPLPGHQRKK